MNSWLSIPEFKELGIIRDDGKELSTLNPLDKIISLCNDKYGRTPMFFDDVVIENEEALDKVSKNSIIMVWGYEMEWNKLCNGYSMYREFR